MARGNYFRQSPSKVPLDGNITIPARATRQLPSAVNAQIAVTPQISEELIHPRIGDRYTSSEQLSSLAKKSKSRFQVSMSVQHVSLAWKQHHYLRPWIIYLICSVLFLGTLLAAAINLRGYAPQLLYPSKSGAYSVQVGTDWQQDQPLVNKNPLLPSGPYSVLGKPTISATFINQVLAAYHSPAAGKGQILYDLGVQYGVDPAFALAFFMHESSFGTTGEAAKSLSLGNLRCIPHFRCQDNFAWFDTWEDGFKAWYELIRNLYVAQWNLQTVDQIIPKYAPAADHNDEGAYIAALKHAIDTWRANVIVVSG